MYNITKNRNNTLKDKLKNKLKVYTQDKLRNSINDNYQVI